MKEHSSGRLTLRQRNFAKLVAGGMNEKDAMKEVGYSIKIIDSTLNKLKNNKRVVDLIKLYSEGPIVTNEIADSRDRQLFWTNVMNDPSFPPGTRLEASKLLGKSQGDFIDRRQVETTEKKNPIVMMPNTSPKEWEEQWEETNG